MLMMAVIGSAQVFEADTISDAVFARMKGKSFGATCTIPRSDLRYLRIAHYDADGQVCQGELVCHRKIAQALLDIFTELYRQHYPIQRMRLIDDYDGDDERSMQANNTSCFNFRRVAGSSRLSAHAQGLAIDINPLYNPCVRRQKNGALIVQPATGRPYADRSRKHTYKIEQGDLCYRLFTKHGFTWGGAWKSLKDYQHFEYSGN
jgi:hypothetical protein